VDWVVEMARFDQAALFDALAAAGRLDLSLMAPLAEEIAAFHEGSEPRPALGGEAGIRRVIARHSRGLSSVRCGHARRHHRRGIWKPSPRTLARGCKHKH
jgi:aminoglycoside phosphotransferase family enzyme